MNDFDLTIAREMIPANARKWMYVVISLAGVVLTAVMAGFAAAAIAIPVWVTVGLTVLGVLAGPFGFLAANNVTLPPKEVEVPVDTL
jgi:hypothetical protein